MTASRLEPLFDRMAGVMASSPLPPLARETVIVAQNVGLRKWVERALAHRLGVAASLDLQSPRGLATTLARALPGAGAAEAQHPFDAGPLAWRLDGVLAALPEDAVWAPVRAYLDRTDGQTMPLATRLAELFDNYQVYRPQILAGWAQGTAPPADFAHGPWQAELWRRLVADAGDTWDRATEMLTLLGTLADLGAPADPHNLADPAARLWKAMPERRVSVFGALLFPPVYLRVLHALSRHVPVTVYATVPGAPSASHRHPLLRALAGRTRDYWTVLGTLGDAPCEPVDPVCLGDAPSALAHLQAALAGDTLPTETIAADASIRIHDCHSERRELEALRDSLLDAFAEVDGLRPSDVLVLTPDLDRYAPLVDAVFGAEDAAPDLRIPYHVVEHPHAPALRVVEAFSRTLRLHEGRVTASELLDLLGTPAIRQAAGIDADELPRLRSWITEAGVCWGLTAERKARFGLPEDDLHTWRFGLDRLLLGVMTGDADGELVLGHLPSDAASVDPELLGRFCEWAEALFSALDAIDRPAPLADWPARILSFLDGVFEAQEDEELEAVVFLRGQALELERLQGLIGHEESVPFRTIRSHLDGAAGRFERREPYLTGHVTVAHPMSLRYAPHRVVAFLGLNDGMWPRPELSPGFDLIAHAPEPGDAASRSEEKQLFLDAVLAARDRLVLSYVGRSQKDNAERAASVCLDAFLDAARRHVTEADQLVVQHRLQPFAADYFDASPSDPLPTAGGPAVGPRVPASYAAQHLTSRAEPPASFFDAATRLSAPDVAKGATLSLEDLAAAWTNPSRYVVRRRLRANLDLDQDALRDQEPVALGGLDKWKVRQAVLDGRLAGQSDAKLEAQLMRSGLLPGGAPGTSWVRQAGQEVAPLVETVLGWGETEPRAVDLEVGGVRLAGTVRRVSGERGALRYRAGTVRQKDLVAAWIDHLVLEASASSAARCTCAVGTSGTAHFTEVDPEHARAYLAALVRGWRRVQRSAMPLFEHASYAYAKELGAGDLATYAGRVRQNGPSDEPFRPPAKAMKKARAAFSPYRGAPDSPPGDDGDPYVALATRGRTDDRGEPDPFVPEEHFQKWALGLWAPLLHHLRDGVPQ